MSRPFIPASVALALLSTTAAAAPGAIRAVGVLRNVDQGLCLDTNGALGEAGVILHLWTVDTGADQGWGFDLAGHIVNGAQGLCLAPVTPAAAKDSYVTLAACNAERYQQWTLNPRTGAGGKIGFEVRNKLTGYCLDIEGGYVGAQGRRLQLWDCDVHNDQLWNLDTASSDGKNTVAHIPADKQAAWFRLISSPDPTINMTAAQVATALAQGLVVPPVFATTASTMIGGDPMKGVTTTVPPQVFAGVGKTLYAITSPSPGVTGLRQWTLNGDFGASPSPLGEIACWDRNQNGLHDLDEDKNKDGIYDRNDCGASPAGASPSYLACWSGDVAGQARGSLRDGVADYHDCEYACWDTNHNHRLDAGEDSLLTDDARASWASATSAWQVEKATWALARCSAPVNCASAPFSPHADDGKCAGQPTWNGPDGDGGTRQTCIGGSVGPVSVFQCTCVPASFRAAPRPANQCKVGRGSVTVQDLGTLPPPPATEPAERRDGWTDYRRVFGTGATMYAVDNLGQMWAFQRGATGYQPPMWLLDGWNQYPSIFGGLDGVIYMIDSGRRLLMMRIDLATGAITTLRHLVASNLPSTFGFGGTDGGIYVQNALDGVTVYLNPLRTVDPTTIPPASWGGDAPALAIAGGVMVSLDNGVLRATQLAGDPAAQLPGGSPVVDRLCIPQTSICLEARGGMLAGSGTRYSAAGDVALTSPAGTWPLGAASLTIDLSPTTPFITGTATIGLPDLGLLHGAFTTKAGAKATLSIGFGGSFTATIGAGDKAITTDPSKFYVYADVDGDITMNVLGTDVALSSYLPLGSTLHKGKLLFEPTTPILYADGLMAYGLLNLATGGNMGWLQEPVVGFSLGPCIPSTLSQPMPRATISSSGGQVSIVHDDAGSTRSIAMCSNLVVSGKGTIDAGKISVDLAGSLAIDLDLDNDGVLATAAGERNDFAFGVDADATVSLYGVLPAYGVHGTVYYEGVVSAATDPDCTGCGTGAVGGSRPGAGATELGQGRLRIVYASGGVNPFAGTPLAALDLVGAASKGQADFLVGQVGVAAPAGSTPEWVRMNFNTFKLLGWTGGSLQMTLSRIGASFTANLSPLFDMATQTMTGTANWDGSAAACGDYRPGGPVCATSDAQVKLGGYTLAQSHVRTDFAHWNLDGRLDLGGIHATVAGTADPTSGVASLTGSVHVGGSWSETVDTGLGTSATGKVSLAGEASLELKDNGGRFFIGATASISGCYPTLVNCITDTRSLGTLQMDSLGRVEVTNPFDSSKTFLVSLAP